MWTLLHVTLTAVAARGISGRYLLGDGSVAADGNAEDLVGISETIDFVRTFVGAFLSCHHCKEHFLRDFDNCEYGRCKVSEYRGLPLWLWRVHNAISLRVARRHNAMVDRRWPMYEDCPTCWRESLVMGGQQTMGPGPATITMEDLDAPFHKDRVFWHMVRTYIGVQRVSFDLSDLSLEEQEEVQEVLERERAIAAGEQPTPRPKEKPHQGFWTWLMIPLAAVASGTVGILLYRSQERNPRAPQFRSPGANQNDALAREEESDFVEDGEMSKTENRAEDEDPAAE